jgi:hypothetical protein
MALRFSDIYAVQEGGKTETSLFPKKQTIFAQGDLSDAAFISRPAR